MNLKATTVASAVLVLAALTATGQELSRAVPDPAPPGLAVGEPGVTGENDVAGSGATASRRRPARFLKGRASVPGVHPVGLPAPCYPVNRQGVPTDGVCREIDVTCAGIGPRRATIIVRRPAVQTRGNAIFFTGELSTARYSKNIVRRLRILEPLLNGGFSTFEVYFEAWDYEDQAPPAPENPNPDYPAVPGSSPTDGLFHATAGAGIDFTCAGDAIMRHIVDTYVLHNPDYVCAAGNSNGGVLIAGALTLYGAEEYLRSAVISAGPPLSQLYEGCAGTEGLAVQHSAPDLPTERLPAHVPVGAPNGAFSPMELIDKLVGTYDPADYFGADKNVCARDLALPNDGSVEVALRAHSLVLSGGVPAANGIPRDYEYTTFVDFVSAAEDLTGAGTSPFGNRQGNYYYELVALHSPLASARTVIGEPGNDHPSTPPQIDGDVHTLDSYADALGQTPGADAIRQKLMTRCSPF